MAGNRHIPNRIFLIGMMGSGKSTLGKGLAKQFSYGFVDLDAHVESHAGKSVAAIFEQDGEAAFRKLEQLALQALIAGDEKQVIALGGGTPVAPGAMDALLEAGLVVYLEVSGPELVRRLERRRKKRPEARPLLTGLSSIDAKVNALLEERGPIYSRAHICIKDDKLTVGRLQMSVEAYLGVY